MTENNDSSCQTRFDKSLETTLKNSPMLKFYTGIPDWCVFKSLYDLAAVDINTSSKLSKFDVLAVFL